MASTTSATSLRPLDALRKTVDEVVVETVKIIKASSKGAEQAKLHAQTRQTAAIERYHVALDDMESEIIRAIAVLRRDLDQKQAKHRVPEPPPVAVQPPAPMVIDLDPPKADQVAAPVAPMMASPVMPNRLTLKTENTAVAPFPDMGIEMPALPYQGLKAKEEKRSPKPTAKSINRPLAKPSPLFNSTAKPAPKAFPTQPTPTAPMPATVSAPATAAKATPQPPLATSSAPELPQDPLADLNTSNDNPFTDIIFTVDQSNADSHVQPHGDDSAPNPTGFDDAFAVGSHAATDSSHRDTHQAPQKNTSASKKTNGLDEMFNLGEAAENFNSTSNFEDFLEFEDASTNFDTEFNLGNFGN